MITRILFGCLLALGLGFVSGCGGNTQPQQIDLQDQAAELEAEAEAYEAQMDADFEATK